MHLQNRYRGALLLILIFIFSLGLVYAVPPVLQTGNSIFYPELDVVYPKVPYYPANTLINFNIHVFNANGTILTNLTALKCQFHLYENTGTHLIETNFSPSTNGYELEVKINGGLNAGYYPYIVWCNDTQKNQKGYVSNYIEVTQSAGGDAQMFYGIIAAIVLVIGMMILGIYLKNNPVLAIAGILMLTLGYWIFKNGIYLSNNVVTDGIGLVLIGLGGYFVIMSTLSMIEGE